MAVTYPGLWERFIILPAALLWSVGSSPNWTGLWVPMPASSRLCPDHSPNKLTLPMTLWHMLCGKPLPTVLLPAPVTCLTHTWGCDPLLWVYVPCFLVVWPSGGWDQASLEGGDRINQVSSRKGCSPGSEPASLFPNSLASVPTTLCLVLCSWKNSQSSGSDKESQHVSLTWKSMLLTMQY